MKPTHISICFHKTLTIVSQLFHTNSTVKAWHHLKKEYHLNINSYIEWLFPNSIPKKQKFPIKLSHNWQNAKNLISHGHNLIKDSKNITLGKLT